MGTSSERRVRYAVIGLGNIAQVAVLPAFKHAHENSELVALVSNDVEKLMTVGKKWGVEHLGGYDEMEEVLRAANADAVYIALPNSLHREFTERAARAGMHVLCEKPMAMTVADCEAMIAACDDNDVRLMIAYRLHFDEANLQAVRLVESGELGELRYFSAVYSHDVRPGDIRTRRETGGGALFDMGIYCLNAARYLFRDEPLEVLGMNIHANARFASVDAATSAMLRFSGDRVAQFTCNQIGADVDEYRLVGTKGDLRVEPAFTYRDKIRHYVTLGEDTKSHKFVGTDQFAPELVYFSNCILDHREPEPNGYEGLADVRVLRAIQDSADAGQRVVLPKFQRNARPEPQQSMRKSPVGNEQPVRAPSPNR